MLVGASIARTVSVLVNMLLYHLFKLTSAGVRLKMPLGTLLYFISMSVEKFLAENTKNTVKYIIKKELRWRIRDMLDQLNINERTVYPGLDGLSRWLARHYFVREE